MARKPKEAKEEPEKKEEKTSAEEKKDIVKEIPAEKFTEEIIEGDIKEPEKEVERVSERAFNKESWNPKTGIGKKVKSGEINDINEIVDNAVTIKEAEIVDILLPDIKTDLLMIGQSKGKFGGGQRRVFRQTQKKTQEGNKPKFSTIALVGNENGYVGIGYGKAKETVPSREKALRNAKINVIKIRRGCGSWQCGCKTPHSIPFKVSGKCGSVKIDLMPAPKGTGLCIEKECGKMLKAAGIKDVWSKSEGKTTTKSNMIYACFAALQNLMQIKIHRNDIEKLGINEGKIKAEVGNE